MQTLISIRRNSINRKTREAAKYWRGVSLAGHFIAGQPVPNRAWLTLDERAQADGVSTDTVITVLNLQKA